MLQPLLLEILQKKNFQNYESFHKSNLIPDYERYSSTANIFKLFVLEL